MQVTYVFVHLIFEVSSFLPACGHAANNIACSTKLLDVVLNADRLLLYMSSKTTLVNVHKCRTELLLQVTEEAFFLALRRQRSRVLAEGGLVCRTRVRPLQVPLHHMRDTTHRTALRNHLDSLSCICASSSCLQHRPFGCPRLCWLRQRQHGTCQTELKAPNLMLSSSAYCFMQFTSLRHGSTQPCILASVMTDHACTSQETAF